MSRSSSYRMFCTITLPQNRSHKLGTCEFLLDPACGSGAFLFSALRRLAEQGLTGAALVDFALDNVMGMDVHPLAVTIAKINYLLALLPHLQQDTRRQLRSIPVALANTLQTPTKAHKLDVVQVYFDAQRPFEIPVTATVHPNKLADTLAEMKRVALLATKTSDSRERSRLFAGFGDHVKQTLHADEDGLLVENSRATWLQNVRYLTEQIELGRDTIWEYVLQNIARPLVLRRRKFDVVAGNPPWISYRYLLDKTYQAEVKQLAKDYGLMESSEVKLHTQLELSTIFYEHCWRSYVRVGGTLAFVLPRSVLTGAKQHRAFQQLGFSRVLDFKEVAPLFNVETCVLIRSGKSLLTERIPTATYAGRLPSHECSLAVAQLLLSRRETETTFSDSASIASPRYYDAFKQGATLVPRNLTFVTSAQEGLEDGQVAHSPIMRTDPDLDAEAKTPWKGLRLEGYVDEAFLYASVLSKEVVPFGIRRFRLVALPTLVGLETRLGAERADMERFVPVTLSAMEDGYGLPGRLNPSIAARTAKEWFLPADKLWEQYRKSAMSLWERYNYQQGVTAQVATPSHLVLYGATGSNLTAVVVDTTALPVVGGVRPQAFVVDHMTYWYQATTPQEAHYLAALLNAPCVDSAIKVTQTRGLYGPRHIHRRPFEVCPIPQFDVANTDHQALAALSLQAHAQVKALPLSGGGVVAARKQVRTAIQPLLRGIDTIAARLLSLAPSEASTVADEDEDESVLDEAIEG